MKSKENKPIKKTEPSVLSITDSNIALKTIRENWRGPVNPEIAAAFARLELAVAQSMKKKLPQVHVMTDIIEIEPLELIRRNLIAKDMLFLSRQITYHVSSSSDLPTIWGNADRITLAISQLVEYVVKRADRQSKIEIELSSFSLRGQMGVRIRIEYVDRDLENVSNYAFLDDLLCSPENKLGSSLCESRQAISHEKGKMWAELKKTCVSEYNIVLPASEDMARMPKKQEKTFKYDISIINYANVRKRFGIKKSLALVYEVEHYVKSLIRYPIDMVMSIGDKGIISTVYESQGNSANSVASRISERLGKEEFQINKKTVELLFQYDLTVLTPQSDLNV